MLAAWLFSRTIVCYDEAKSCCPGAALAASLRRSGLDTSVERIVLRLVESGHVCVCAGRLWTLDEKLRDHERRNEILAWSTVLVLNGSALLQSWCATY